MTQTTLFDMRTVRKTSLVAYKAVLSSGLISHRQKEVYDYVYHYGPCSSQDVTKVKTQEKDGMAHSGTYTSRFSELERLGVIERVGTKINEDTGHEVYIWDVTGKAPPERKPKDRLEEILYRLGYNDYNEYLVAEHWIEFRDDYFTTHPRRCFITNRTDHIQLHHITYETLGEEKETDVVSLCADMHEQVHLMISDGLLRLETAHLAVAQIRRRMQTEVVNAVMSSIGCGTISID